MESTSWKEELKKWKSLKNYELRLLEEGPRTQSQAWLFNEMWSEWKKLSIQKGYDNKKILLTNIIDPWFD